MRLTDICTVIGRVRVGATWTREKPSATFAACKGHGIQVKDYLVASIALRGAWVFLVTAESHLRGFDDFRDRHSMTTWATRDAHGEEAQTSKFVDFVVLLLFQFGGIIQSNWAKAAFLSTVTKGTSIAELVRTWGMTSLVGHSVQFPGRLRGMIASIV